MSSQSRRRGSNSEFGPNLRPAPPVAFVSDDDGRGGLTVFVDGVPSSHLDPDDPTRLDFEYMRWMGDALDLLLPAGPLRAVHLGGAGCTLPRYVDATRPASRQEVAEVDAEVVDAVRARLSVKAIAGLRLRHVDGRDLLARLADSRPHEADVVVRDAFLREDVPSHLCTAEFLELVATTMHADGLYLANVPDRPPLRRSRAEAATAMAVFGEVALIAEPAQFKGGHRYGNVVLVAGAPLRDERLVAALERRLACGAVRARLMPPSSVRGFAAGAGVLCDPRPEPVQCSEDGELRDQVVEPE